jgi:protein-L-isoaspartate(D-aspartate) O-methyltransferase
MSGSEKEGLLRQKQELADSWKAQNIFSDMVIDAFMKIPRVDFIPKELEEEGYVDTPLPILRGKTISQPTTVMIMTNELELKEDDVVFEVGTGSGYQTALIAKLVPRGRVISTEILPELVSFAKKNLRDAGISNAEVHEHDGSRGFGGSLRFDKIIITAACKSFPDELIKQLKVGGIIIGPVGTRNEQTLVKGIKQESGRLEMNFLGPFIFSSMYGRYGFEV